MKRYTTFITVVSAGLLASSIASANTQDIATDLIYGNGNVNVSSGERYVAGSSVRGNLSTDLVYGGKEITPSRGEAPERLVDNRDSNTDMIYGS